MSLNQNTIILTMLKNKDNKNIQRKYNVYLQQTIDTLINSVMPELKVATYKRDKHNNPEKLMPSNVIPGPCGKVLDGVVILNSVANWINNDLSADYSDLNSDLRLMLKLCVEFENGDHLNKSDLYNF